MSNYLITPTLLNSFSYYMSEYGKREDFLKTLTRERSEPTPAMLKGIDFEEAIYQHCCLEQETKQQLTSNDAVADAIVRIVSGGVWQAKVQKPLKIGDTEYLVYGKCDNIKEDWIYDIKYTKNYEVGKFSKSIQHPIYMYCTGLSKFAYLISDGKEWWREDYQASRDIESDIKGRITEFRDYLAGDKEAENLFLTKWISQ